MKSNLKREFMFLLRKELVCLYQLFIIFYEIL